MRNFYLPSFLIYLLAATVLYAQTDTGAITGTIEDEQGKSLPGAFVAATDTETGIEQLTTTNEQGIYYLTQLRPGSYDVTARLEGFGTRTESNITVNVGTTVTLNFNLVAGADEMKTQRLEEQIRVVGAPPAIETTKSHISEIVTEQQIENLPLNGRNFLELAFLVPGITPAQSFDPTKGRVVEIASAANMGRGGNILVDNVDNNDDVVGGVLQNFSQDAIAEFQVVTNRFSAQFGRSASSAVNIVTKTGTNDLHGTAFVFYRDEALQKKNSLLAAEAPEPPFDRQQVGFTAGGPLIKNKAFWFISFEFINEDGAVPAARRDTAARNVVNLLSPVPVDDLLFTVRADVKLNENNSLSSRYSWQDNDIPGAGFTLSGGVREDVSNFQVAENRLHSLALGWTKLISEEKVNELRGGVVSFYNFLGPVGDPPELNFPSIVVGHNFLLPQRTRMNRLQLKDDFTWLSGNHMLQFGGEYQKIDTDVLADFFRSGSVILEEDFATEDRNGDGVINDNDIRVLFAIRSAAPDAPFLPNVDNTYFAVYIQDDWRIRPNLTFNLGLRYELETQTNGANDFNLQERVVFQANDTGQRQRDKNNWAPRLGFVWDVGNDGKTVMRGGYGIYYDRIVLNTTALERLLNGKALPTRVFGESLLEDPFGGEASDVNLFGLVILQNDLHNPRVQQFSVGLEKQLGLDFTVSADYVGVRGDHFLFVREVNHPRIGIQVNPNIPESVGEIASIAKANYDGLLVSARRRLGENLQMQVSYTLARGENWGNDDQGLGVAPTLDAADPSLDQSQVEYLDTHRLVVNGTYRLPRDFQISGIFTYASGVPFDIATNQDFLGDGTLDRFPLLPRNAGGRDVQSGAELNEWIALFNTSNDPGIVAMRNQCGCTLPLVDPNLEFTDNFINLDLRFSKPFGFGQYIVEPIFEVFNVFNVLNIRGASTNGLAGYVRNMESPEFGTPVSTAGGVFGQGGPFAVQLAIKFRF